MWRLSYRPEVEDDLVDAALWYDRKRRGLGDEFLAEFVSAIGRIQSRPTLFAVGENGLRACRVKRFSYVIHFHVDDAHVVIVAVMGSGRSTAAIDHRNE